MHRIRFTHCALLLSLSVLLSAFLPAAPARASIDNAGTTAGNFLSVGTGAGILSMGGATLASGHDLNAAAWNPAALGFMNGTQISLAHASLSASTSQEFLASGGRVGATGLRWGANLLYQSEGAFDGTDATGASTGSFNVANTAMGLNVARPFGQAVNVGLGMRYVNEKLGDVSGSGLGFDLGLQAHAGEFGFGVAGRNLGGKMKYDSGSYDLPSVIGAGVSWASPATGLRLAIDANLPKAYYNDVRVGGEWMWQDRVALRAGYRMEMGAPAGEPLGGPTFGFGAGVAGMWMDYAFLAGQSDAQGQHRLGLTLRPSLMHSGLSPVGANANTNGDHVVATPEHTAVAAAAPKNPSNASPNASSNSAPAPAPVASNAPAKAATPSVPDAERAIAENARQPQLSSNVPTGYAPALVRDAASAAPAPAPAVTPAPVAASTPKATPAPQAATRAPVSAPAPAPVLAAASQLASDGNGTDSAIAPRGADTHARNLRASRPVRVPRLLAMTPAAAGTAAKPGASSKVAADAAKPSSLRPAVVELATAPMAATPAPSAPAPSAAAPSGPTQVASTNNSAPQVTVVPPTPLKPAPSAATPSAPAPAPPIKRPAFVVVGNGDTMASIAKQWGTSVPAIMMENNLVTDSVKQGAKLKLPPPDKH